MTVCTTQTSASDSVCLTGEAYLSDRLNTSVCPQFIDEMDPNLIDLSGMPNRPPIQEGIAKKLNRPFSGTLSDPGLLKEVRKRYREVLGCSMPRSVKNWLTGHPIGTDKMRNHYDLTVALGMDLAETESFFYRYYLMEPFHVKARTDAVFYYGITHNLSYERIRFLLEQASAFPATAVSNTATCTVMRQIAACNGESEFLSYLSRHTYPEREQYQRAKRQMREWIRACLDLTNSGTYAETYEMVVGISYQKTRVKEKQLRNRAFPKEITYCFPTDRTFWNLMKEGCDALPLSYETLRKTFLILHFFRFYEAEAASHLAKPTMAVVREQYLDYRTEADLELLSAGLGKLCAEHPFDWLLLYCATFGNPIDAWHNFNRARFQKARS